MLLLLLPLLLLLLILLSTAAVQELVAVGRLHTHACDINGGVAKVHPESFTMSHPGWYQGHRFEGTSLPRKRWSAVGAFCSLSANSKGEHYGSGRLCQANRGCHVTHLSRIFRPFASLHTSYAICWGSAAPCMTVSGQVMRSAILTHSFVRCASFFCCASSGGHAQWSLTLCSHSKCGLHSNGFLLKVGACELCAQRWTECVAACLGGACIMPGSRPRSSLC